MVSRSVRVADVLQRVDDKARAGGVGLGQASTHVHELRLRADGLFERVAQLKSLSPEARPVVESLLEELDVNAEELRVVEDLLTEQSERDSVASRVEPEQAYYRDLFRFSLEAELITDDAGLIREVSERAARMLDAAGASLTGMPLTNYLGRTQCRLFRQRLGQIASGNAVPPFFVRFSPKVEKAPLLAELSGRRIGEGSSSVVVWTLRERPGPASTRRREADVFADTTSHTPADLTGVRVCLVQPDRVTRPSWQRSLLTQGAHVKSCASGLEAISVLEDGSADVVIVDLELGADDPYDLVGYLQLAAAKTGRSIPAIALTRAGMIEESRRALVAGYQALVAKPIDAMLLTHAIANIAASPG